MKHALPADVEREKYLQQLIRQNCAAFTPSIFERLLNLLIVAREQYGDIEGGVIFCTVMLRSLRSPLFSCRPSQSTEQSPVDYDNDLPGTNVSSISDATGIPRETVRRKVAELERRGLVHRNDNGIYASFTAICDVTACQDRFVELCAHIHTCTDALLARDGHAHEGVIG